MTNAKRAAWTVALALALAGMLALTPRDAEAQGHGGGHRGGHGGGGVAYVGGFYGPAWGYGWAPWWGFGPYWGAWGPYGYPAGGGIDMNYAMIAGFGAVELNVKPNRADVWVDGKYIGEARDLDGYPSYLWLADGGHKLAVYKGGYKTFEEEISVQRGMRTEIKLPPGAGRLAPAGTEARREAGRGEVAAALRPAPPPRRRPGTYSYRSASIGSSCAARRAGK